MKKAKKAARLEAKRAKSSGEPLDPDADPGADPGAEPGAGPDVEAGAAGEDAETDPPGAAD